MFRRIHWRIAISFAILVLIAMGALDLYLSNLIRTYETEALREALNNDAALIVEALELGDLKTAPPETLDEFAEEWSELLGMRVTFIAADGTVIGESDEDRTQMENHADRPEFIDAIQNGKGDSIRFSETLGFDMLYAAVALSDGQQPLGVVRLASPLSQIELQACGTPKDSPGCLACNGPNRLPARDHHFEPNNASTARTDPCGNPYVRGVGRGRRGSDE